MFEVLGWLVCGLVLVWASIGVLFATVSTFGDAAFDSEHWYVRLLGAMCWVIVIGLWMLWLSVIEISV